MHDFDVIARFQPGICELTTRHDLLIELDRQTFSGQLQIGYQSLKIAISGQSMRFAIQYDFHVGILHEFARCGQRMTSLVHAKLKTGKFVL